MSNVEASWPPTTSRTVWLIESHTSAAPRTVQTISTETTITMPRAIESRKEVFITDQASIWTRRSWARRVRRGALFGLALLFFELWLGGTGGS